MARKQHRTIQKYKVNVAMKAWDLAKAGAAITLIVRDRNGLVGKIEIGQGTCGFKSTHHTTFKRVRWIKLFRLIEDHG